MNFERHTDIKKGLDIGLGDVIEAQSIAIKYWPDELVNELQVKELNQKQAEAVLRVLSTGEISKEDNIQLISIDTRDKFTMRNIDYIKIYEKGKKRRKAKWQYISVHLPTWEMVLPYRIPVKVAYMGKIYNPGFPECVSSQTDNTGPR